MKSRLALALTTAVRAFAVAGLLLWTSPASATLTSSEKAQIRDFVAGGRAENAGRVRALVARTDLGVEESIAALTEAVTPVPFNEQRQVFLREIAFGVASASSRPLLAHAVTRSVLARADTIYQKYVGGLDHEPRAIAELVAIYAFLDATIANAGKPTLAAHDGASGVSSAAYDECSKALREHVEKNPRWLKGDAAVPESVGRLRAQAQSALFDMLPDGLTRRVDAADRLALKGPRRQILTDWGILFVDTGKLDETKLERVRQVMSRLPGARVDLSLVYAGDDRGALRSRGMVAFVGGPSTGTAGEASPFGPEVTASATVDGTLSAIVEDLAVMAVKRALDNRGELRTQADRDATSTQGDPSRVLGKPEAPSVEHVVGAAAHLLLLDAPRTLDLAFSRAIAGRPESAGLLADAVGALAVFASSPEGAKAGQGPQLEVGKGALAPIPMTALRLAPNGTAAGFTLDGHAWTIERAGGAGAVSGVLRDGQPVVLSQLTTVKPPKPATPKATPAKPKEAPKTP